MSAAAAPSPFTAGEVQQLAEARAALRHVETRLQAPDLRPWELADLGNRLLDAHAAAHGVFREASRRAAAAEPAKE